MEEKRCERERKDERAFVALRRSPVTFIDVPLASSIGSGRSACQLNTSLTHSSVTARAIETHFSQQTAYPCH